MSEKGYDRDSLERALIHFGIDYSPPERGGVGGTGGRGARWRVTTHLGPMLWTGPQVYSFVVGMKLAEDTAEKKARAANNGYPAFIDGGDLPPQHRFDRDTDRCVCGGEEVYFEDQRPPGHGCEVEGHPWVRKDE